MMSCLCPRSELWLRSPSVVAYCPPLVLVRCLPSVVDYRIGLLAFFNDRDMFCFLDGRGGSEFLCFSNNSVAATTVLSCS